MSATISSTSAGEARGPISLLALVWSDRSPLLANHGIVERLVRDLPQMGLKAHPVSLGQVPPDDPEPRSPRRLNPRDALPSPWTIRFHNPTAMARDATLIFDLRRLPPGSEVAIEFLRGGRFARVDGGGPLAGLGFSTVPSAGSPIVAPPPISLEPVSLRLAAPDLAVTTHRACGGGILRAAGVDIPAHDYVAARIGLLALPSGAKEKRPWIEAQQWNNGALVGACQIRIELHRLAPD